MKKFLNKMKNLFSVFRQKYIFEFDCFGTGLHIKFTAIASNFEEAIEIAKKTCTNNDIKKFELSKVKSVNAVHIQKEG